MEQVIEVRGHRLRYSEDGRTVFECYCGHGRGGITTRKREGDGCTPAGTFAIESAFGFGPAPSGCRLPYREIGPDSWWSGEREDYNRWVEVPAGTRSMSASEHLSDYPVQYRYSFVIGYNTGAPEWGLGSAIFMHCRNTPKWQTAGCISLPESRIRYLLGRLAPGAVIKIASPSE